MQLASITFDGEKKNSKHYIIPASYFKKKGITPIPVTVPAAKPSVPNLPQKQQLKQPLIAPAAKKLEPTVKPPLSTRA